jgi:hypothetical protein
MSWTSSARYAILACSNIPPDYTVSYVPGALTVSPAPLIISADSKIMTRRQPAGTDGKHQRPGQRRQR